MTPPRIGQRVLASKTNPSIQAGFLFGHVIAVSGDNFKLRRTTGKVQVVPWRGVDGRNHYLDFED